MAGSPAAAGAGGAGSGGTPTTAGQAGTAGANSLGGAAGSAGGGVGGHAETGTCSPGLPVLVGEIDGTAVVLNTTDAVCVVFEGTLHGWQASELQGRTVALNGTDVTDTLGEVVAAIDGHHYFEFSSGSVAHTSMSAW